MITDITNLYPTLQTLVANLTGISASQVILADQGAPAPSGLYATYKPVAVRAYGHPRHDRALVSPVESTNLTNWEDFADTVVSQMEFLLSVNCLNSGAQNAIWKLYNANFRQPIQQYLWDNDIGWRGVSEARDLTDLDRGAYQERWQADINIIVETAVTVDVLRANDFDFIIEDGAGNTVASWP